MSEKVRTPYLWFFLLTHSYLEGISLFPSLYFNSYTFIVPLQPPELLLYFLSLWIFPLKD